MTTDVQKRLLVVLFSLGAAAMLLGALGDRENAYYNLLRWVVSFAALLVGVLGFQWRHFWAVGIFAFIAALFNPLAPVSLSRHLWAFVDMGTASLFLLAVAYIEPPGQLARLLGRKRRLVLLVMAFALPIALVATAFTLDAYWKSAQSAKQSINAIAKNHMISQGREASIASIAYTPGGLLSGTDFWTACGRGVTWEVCVAVDDTSGQVISVQYGPKAPAFNPQKTVPNFKRPSWERPDFDRPKFKRPSWERP